MSLRYALKSNRRGYFHEAIILPIISPIISLHPHVMGVPLDFFAGLQ
jgi:hypothetical protein